MWRRFARLYNSIDRVYASISLPRSARRQKANFNIRCQYREILSQLWEADTVELQRPCDIYSKLPRNLCKRGSVNGFV